MSFSFFPVTVEPAIEHPTSSEPVMVELASLLPLTCGNENTNKCEKGFKISANDPGLSVSPIKELRLLLSGVASNTIY